MSESRFEELAGGLIDDELDTDELAELIELVRCDPQMLDELCAQLEASELIAQAEDDLRDSALFVAATKARTGDDAFVERIRSALRPGSSVGDVESPGGGRWSSPFTGRVGVTAVLAIVAAAAVGLFFAFRSTPAPANVDVSIARIKALHGSVQWTGNGGQVIRELEVGRAVQGGTLEPLAADSWAEIEFRDGTTVAVFGRSALTIAEQNHKELHLRHGSLSASVKPQPASSPLRIHTPTAELEVLGTQLNVDADAAATVLTVNEGRVRVKRLADGLVAEVPADHQIVAAADRRRAFNPTRRPRAVHTWSSNLPEEMIYGRWEPGRGIRSTALLWHDCKHPERKPLLLFVSAMSVSRGEKSVVLRPATRFRIRGRMDADAELFVGLTTKHPRGGFAGKYSLHHPSAGLRRVDGSFELEVLVTDFVPEEPDYAKSAIGLEVFDVWCLTINVDAGLSINSVELLPAGRKQD